MNGPHSKKHGVPHRGGRSPARLNEHMSVDTRLAAKAILDDESVGLITQSAVTPARSGFTDWLLKARVKLTIGACLVMVLVTCLPIWFELSHRNKAKDLQASLSTQADVLFNSIGAAKLKLWFNGQNIEKLRAHYLAQRPTLLANLKADGVVLQEDDLSVRLDYENKTLLLGAKVDQGDQGVFMTWASPKNSVSVRPIPNASLGAVVDEKKDMLIIFGTMIGLFLVFVWMAPAFTRRRDASD